MRDIATCGANDVMLLRHLWSRGWRETLLPSAVNSIEFGFNQAVRSSSRGTSASARTSDRRADTASNSRGYQLSIGGLSLVHLWRSSERCDQPNDLSDGSVRDRYAGQSVKVRLLGETALSGASPGKSEARDITLDF